MGRLDMKTANPILYFCVKWVLLILFFKFIRKRHPKQLWVLFRKVLAGIFSGGWIFYEFFKKGTYRVFSGISYENGYQKEHLMDLTERGRPNVTFSKVFKEIEAKTWSF